MKNTLLKIALIFITSYLVFLIVWLGVKDHYGRAVTEIATYFITIVKEVNLEEIVVKDDIIIVSFIPQRHKANIIIDIDVKTSSYTFNAPLTFAIMAAFYPFLRRSRGSPKNRKILQGKARVYLEVLSILFIVHILYVFFSEGEKLTAMMVTMGYEEAGLAKLVFWQFLWGFVENMVIRFEPFLIGAYLYFKIKG